MKSNSEFFFGQNYRSLRLHVVRTAWIFVAIDFFLILLLSGIFNLTVGKFDAFSVLLSLLFISVLGSAVYGIVVRRYIFMWPLLLCKAAEVAITVIILIIAFLLLIFDRQFLIKVIGMRMSSIEGQDVSRSQETLHIAFTFVYLFCQLFYSLLLLYVFFSVMDYFRKRTLFAYRQRLSPTYDFISRIHSVRHKEHRIELSPRLLPSKAAEQHPIAIDDDKKLTPAAPLPPPLLPLHKNIAPRVAPPPLFPLAPDCPLAPPDCCPLAVASMTQSYSAPPTSLSHSRHLAPRRHSCQRDPTEEPAAGMLSSAIHKMADRQCSVPLVADGGWRSAVRAGHRSRAATGTSEEAGWSSGAKRERRSDSQGRSRSLLTARDGE